MGILKKGNSRPENETSDSYSRDSKKGNGRALGDEAAGRLFGVALHRLTDEVPICSNSGLRQASAYTPLLKNNILLG